jgi:hypothetical protein
MRAIFVVAGLAATSGAAFAQHSDNFDSYPSNASINGLGGWKGWDNVPANAASTSTTQARSAPNSIILKGNAATETDYTDNVHEYNLTSGKWAYTVYHYVPTGQIEDSYFILLNRYIDGIHVGGDWSVEVQFNATSNLVIDDFSNAVAAPHTRTGGPVTLIRDRWVPVVATFDLDNNTVEITYDGAPLSSGTWTTAAGSQLAMQAVDLFSFHVPRTGGHFMDDISLEQVNGDPCDAADFNGDNQVDFFDYLDFAQAFSNEEDSADFNGDNQVDFFDYLDFAQAFSDCS